MNRFADIGRGLSHLWEQLVAPNRTDQPQTRETAVAPPAKHYNENVTRQTSNFKATTILFPLHSDDLIMRANSERRETRAQLDLRDIADGQCLAVIKGAGLGAQYTGINHYYMWVDRSDVYLTNVPQSTLVKAPLARMNTSLEFSPKGILHSKDVDGLAVGNAIMMPQFRSVNGVTNILLFGGQADARIQTWGDTISEICIVPLSEAQVAELRRQASHQ